MGATTSHATLRTMGRYAFLCGCFVTLAHSGSTVSEQFLAQRPPSWPLPLGVDALADVIYPAEWPWDNADFRREDESDDKHFYREPRLVKHIDDNAIEGLKNW